MLQVHILETARAPCPFAGRSAGAHRRIGSIRARLSSPGCPPLCRDLLAALAWAPRPARRGRPSPPAELCLQGLRLATAVRGGRAPAAARTGRGKRGRLGHGLALPGRFDDAVRIAIVRRYPGCPADVRALCLPLVMLGLIDSAALAPLASVAAAFAGHASSVRPVLESSPPPESRRRR